MQGKGFKEKGEEISIRFLNTHSLLAIEPKGRNRHWYRYCCWASFLSRALIWIAAVLMEIIQAAKKNWLMPQSMICLCLGLSLKRHFSQRRSSSGCCDFHSGHRQSLAREAYGGKLKGGHGAHLQEASSFDTLQCGSLGLWEPASLSMFSISEPRPLCLFCGLEISVGRVVVLLHTALRPWSPQQRAENQMRLR